MKNTEAKSIIFDMDGVIALTTQLQSHAESKILSKIGIHMTPKEIVRAYSGWRDIDVFKDILKKHNRNENAHKLRKEKWDMIDQEIAKGTKITVIPGVINFIEIMYNFGFRLAVASSSPRIFINLILHEFRTFI